MFSRSNFHLRSLCLLCVNIITQICCIFVGSNINFIVRKIIYLFLIITTASCNRMLNPSLMFKTPDSYKYSTARDTIVPEYKISPNDPFTFSLATNDGYKLIDYGIQAGSGTSTGSAGGGTGGVGGST